MTTAVALSDAKQALLERMLRGDVDVAGRRRTQPVERRAPDAVIPLSAAQRQVWLHAAMAPHVPLYNESITIHRLGTFDLAAMEASLNALITRHEIWRTSFRLDGVDPIQVVHEALTIRLSVEDVSHLPEAERDAAAVRIATADAATAIDFTRPPLFRARVVKLGPEEHRLYLTLHHMIFDGVSIYRIIVPELAALYDAHCRGVEAVLPEVTIGYGDYAVWQKAHLAAPTVQRQVDYWRATLADLPPKLELAGDRPKPAVPTHAGSMECFAIPQELTERLKRLSRARHVTMYMTLLAAFKAMLHLYTGEEDITVGGVTDLRRRPELDRVVGYFLNTLALRSRPSAEVAFSAYLDQVRDMLLGALGASELPFDEVVHALGIRRTPGTHPLFNILFSVEPPVDPFPEGWDLTQMDVVVGGAKFDLYLELDERPEGMIGRFLYSTELFDATTIRRMIGHWLTLLDAVVDNPDQRIADLPLMTVEQRDELLIDWNATQVDVRGGRVDQWIREQARITPDKIAVESDGQSWTYRELDEQSDRVAAGLRQAGIEDGALVGIYMNRSANMLAGLIGIWKAGAAYLPLDLSFPQSRLAFIIDNAQPAVLLTEEALHSSLPVAHLPVVLYDEQGDIASTELPDCSASGQSLAYVIYTSGSTGMPKGVEVPHSAVVNFLSAMQMEPGFGPDDCLLSVLTIAFDVSVHELFWPLVSGGRVVIAPREIAVDPQRLVEEIGRSACSMVIATPATWRALVETGWQGSDRLTLLSCGEMLPRALADELQKRCGSLWNCYGPTETTVASAIHKVSAGTGPVPIGRPIANTQIYILDRSGNPVPVGIPGELYIAGAGVARGYRNNAALTAERFVTRACTGAAKLYRTGDMARYRPDGLIEHLGRADCEEKIRGFRVAVEEIEGALCKHDQISAAAVRSWPDSSGNKALAAYVVTDRQDLSLAEARAFLGETLPDYMLPSQLILVSELPKTASGKLDRKKLPPPETTTSTTASLPPQGPAEERLAVIWGQVLGLSSVSRNENFFELGGHSLLLARLLREVEAEYGIRLTMASFFRAPTIEGMVGLLEANDSLSSPVIPVQPKGSRPPLLWIGGSAMFWPLAQAIGLDQPFLGIPLERVGDDHKTLEDLASSLVSIILETQPTGPFYLGGYCDMGVVAYEAAVQLTNAGHVVGLVTLLDSTSPIAPWKTKRVGIIFSRARHHWKHLRCLRGRARREYIAKKMHNAKRDLGFRPNDVWEELAKLVRPYRPSALQGNVILFQSADRLDIVDNETPWRQTVRGTMVARDTPGNHQTMIEEPDVRQLGSVLGAALLRAQMTTFDVSERADQLA